MMGKQAIRIALGMVGVSVLAHLGGAQTPDCIDPSTRPDSRLPFASILESGALKKSDGSQSEAACRDALRNDPANPTNMFRLARTLTLANKAHEAIKYYFDAADRRHADAMNDLGGVFEYGLGVPKNLMTALEWYERAAGLGHTGAMTHLGELSEKSVPRDLDSARHWYEKAAMLGDAVAMNALANLLRETSDPAAAASWYRKAAAQGFANAMRSLGELTEAGLGVAQDHGTAREWYRKAADLGDADAMGHLGVLLESGLGGPQNVEAAREWYLKGAALGSPVAMHNLGAMFENGRGTSQDFSQAKSWYERAAAQVYPPALNDLGRLYRDGAGVAKNYARAKSLFEQASSLGDARAMNNLGLLYLDGRGALRDIKTARTWFEQAAALNNADAQANLRRLDRAGLTDGTQIAARRASCASSCADLQRSFVNAVCERYSATLGGEKSDREKCVDTSLTLASQCRNTCRDWASTLLPENTCLTCFRSNIACSAKPVPSIDCVETYADCITRCSREMSSSGMAD